MITLQFKPLNKKLQMSLWEIVFNGHVRRGTCCDCVDVLIRCTVLEHQMFHCMLLLHVGRR